MSTKRQGPAVVIASTIGLDVSELREYRYHYGKTKLALYAVGGHIYCVKPTEPTEAECDDMPYQWTEDSDQFWAKQSGTVVWQASTEASESERGYYSGRQTLGDHWKPTLS